MRAVTSMRSPTVRLTGYRPQSTCGVTVWILMRAGGSFVFGSGAPCGVSTIGGTETVSTLAADEAAALLRDLPAPHVAARRASRRGGVPVRRLARGGRTVVV